MLTDPFILGTDLLFSLPQMGVGQRLEIEAISFVDGPWSLALPEIDSQVSLYTNQLPYVNNDIRVTECRRAVSPLITKEDIVVRHAQYPCT